MILTMQTWHIYSLRLSLNRVEKIEPKNLKMEEEIEEIIEKVKTSAFNELDLEMM